MINEQQDPCNRAASLLVKAALGFALVATALLLTPPAMAGSGWQNPSVHHQQAFVTQRFWHDHGFGRGHWHVRKVRRGHHGQHNGHGHNHGYGQPANGHWHNGQWHSHGAWTQGHRHHHGHRRQGHRTGFFIFFGN